MKLASVEIENFRAIEKLTLALDPRLTVLHGANAHGKTSVLDAIAAGLGAVLVLFPGATEKTERRLLDTDLRVGASGDLFVCLTTVDGISWSTRITGGQPVQRSISTMITGGQSAQESIDALEDKIDGIRSDHNGERPTDLPIVAFYDTAGPSSTGRSAGPTSRRNLLDMTLSKGRCLTSPPPPPRSRNPPPSSAVCPTPRVRHEPVIRQAGRVTVAAEGEQADYSCLRVHLNRYTARNTFD